MINSIYIHELDQSSSSMQSNLPSMSSSSSGIIGIGCNSSLQAVTVFPLPSPVLTSSVGGCGVMVDGEFRIGAYTKQERQLKIEQFREKKRTRIWRKQIKYDCRKRLADTRPR